MKGAVCHAVFGIRPLPICPQSPSGGHLPASVSRHPHHQHQVARRVPGGRPPRLSPLCGPEGAAPPQGDGAGHPQSQAGAAARCRQPQLCLCRRPVENQSHQGLHRAVHPPVHPVGGLCPPAGQASGAVHSGVRARLLRARGAAVCKRGLPEGPGAHRPAVGRSDPFPLPGHPRGAGCG